MYSFILHDFLHGKDNAKAIFSFDQKSALSSTMLQQIYCIYRQVSNISCTLVGNKIVDHSDVVVASPVGAAPTTSSFST